MSSLKNYVRERRVQLAVMMCLVFGALGLFGLYRLAYYTVPMLSGDYVTASGAGVGDKAIALYNAGLDAYQQHNYDAAKKLLTEGYSACTNSRGEMDNSRTELAAKLQFELGLTYEQLEKPKSAIEAYKQALLLDPTNLAAKYNLERLQSQEGGSGGPGDPNSPGGGKPGGPKKGI